MKKCKSQGEAVLPHQLHTEADSPSRGNSVTAEWYAVYTKFQHEKSAAKLLESKNFEVFLPVYRTVHRWQDRNQLVVLPLFPCYLFLRANLDRKLEALQTAGVRWLVENGGNACPISETEIEELRKICSVGLQVQPHPFLKQGDQVRIHRGPLAGTRGFFVREKNHYRVVIAVELLRKGVSVEIDLRDIEPLHESHGPQSVALEFSECNA
jgi:transcription antitermination factor NusG